MSFIDSNKQLGLAMFAASAMCFVLKSSPLKRLSAAGLQRNLASVSAINPPRAKKIEEIMYFGINPKDNLEVRGDKPMNPPKVLILRRPCCLIDSSYLLHFLD